jgi:hypothetical protein
MIERSNGIESFLGNLQFEAFGTDRNETTRRGLCVNCGKIANDFDDEISRREYEISGFCQQCQDEFFGQEDE